MQKKKWVVRAMFTIAAVIFVIQSITLYISTSAQISAILDAMKQSIQSVDTYMDYLWMSVVPNCINSLMSMIFQSGVFFFGAVIYNSLPERKIEVAEDSQAEEDEVEQEETPSFDGVFSDITVEDKKIR